MKRYRFEAKVNPITNQIRLKMFDELEVVARNLDYQFEDFNDVPDQFYYQGFAFVINVHYTDGKFQIQIYESGAEQNEETKEWLAVCDFYKQYPLTWKFVSKDFKNFKPQERE